jgi:hypothetical protein
MHPESSVTVQHAREMCSLVRSGSATQRPLPFHSTYNVEMMQTWLWESELLYGQAASLPFFSTGMTRQGLHCHDSATIA